MKMYLQEKIGNPDLFTGRRNELDFFLKWADAANRRVAKSTAILSRRKTGKTALLQRLYNILFEQNGGVVPFYLEIPEGRVWAMDFTTNFLFTFVYQYLAFRTRNLDYLTRYSEMPTFEIVEADARTAGFDFIANMVRNLGAAHREGSLDHFWFGTRNAPRFVAEEYQTPVVQMIDEFQYLNSEIYRDQATTMLAEDFAGGYMSTAEYRIAPMLISGSWVGWLLHLLRTMLPSRFMKYTLENLPQSEALEMIFNYSQILGIPVTEDSAYLMAQASEGNPFYISALFHSTCPEKDLSTAEGVLKTLEFETCDHRGEIKATWMEYIQVTFSRVNQVNAKALVIYLSKHRDRQVSRKELLTNLQLDMTDFELEQKLHALHKSDIIQAGKSNFYYQGVQDNIFDKVFRSEYADDIEEFDASEITNEYKALFEGAQKKYRELIGKYNYEKGYFAEFLIINHLRFHAAGDSERFCAMLRNLPADFRFVAYQSVWKYQTIPNDKRPLEIDIFARAAADEYSLIWEVKNRDTKAFSRDEAAAFQQKANELVAREQLTKAVCIVFSLTGFTDDTLEFFQQYGIAYSEDRAWLE